MSNTQAQRPRRERKENADRRRRQLLDAARQSILKHGLTKTTLATVATEARLSQGVAAFYFSSKGRLLTEALRDLYESYEALWMAALENAGPDPRTRLMAVVEADFDQRACGPDVLPLWFAYWGELKAQGDYGEVATVFETRRRAVLSELWHDLLPDWKAEDAARMAEWLETLTDGYWQRLHLAPESQDRNNALAATKAWLHRMAVI